MDDTYTVYMHRHKNNGKVYIGCTKKTLNQRFDNGNGYKKCSRFWKAIDRDGFDSFEHIIVHAGLTKDEAYSLEERLVDEYNSMNPDYGYNLRRGGYHNTPCDEVGDNISKAKMGHGVSEETREKLRQQFGRKVLQKSLDGKPIKVYRSLTEAAREVGSFKSNIYAVCIGRKPTCKNYKWEYYDEEVI
jgi:predicted GIY-YIG superfamily endonuclease